MDGLARFVRLARFDGAGRGDAVFFFVRLNGLGGANRAHVGLDLTGGFDYTRVFAAVDAADPARRPPVLAFTTHALARTTQPWHSRCTRVITKETLTQELPTLLREGVTP